MAAVSREAAIEQGISTESSKLLDNPESPPEERAVRLASLVILVQQLEDGTQCSEHLTKLLPSLIERDLQPSADRNVQKNAVVLLTGMISLDERVWRQLVVEQKALVPGTVSMLSSALSATEKDSTAIINLLALLTAIAQRGEEGARSVIDSEGLPVIKSACATNSSDRPGQIQEAAADLICQLATYEGPVRASLAEQKCVSTLAPLLSYSDANCAEVHVRALLGLGMLIAKNQAAQVELASHANVKDLLAIIQGSPDPDAKEIGKDLFKSLAANEESRNAMADVMRSTVNAS